MKEIPLSQGNLALVGDDDFEWLSQWKWHLSTTGYANRTITVSGRTERIHMHRQIVNAPKGMDVDHINRNPLDNRRSNLRVCTHSENMRNSISRVGSSQYKGVSWDKHHKKWGASIKVNYKSVHLGYFANEADAAKAYDAAAHQHHGEFARTNF